MSLWPPPPGSPPWYSTCSAPRLGGGEVLEVKGHRAGQVPEAEARCTSGAQRAAMLERRRRRRGASWVPAAAPVGCSRGSNGAAKWRPVRPRGGRAKGRGGRPSRILILPGLGRDTPPPPRTPPWGCADAVGRPLSAFQHLAAAVTPTPCRRSGPGDAVSQPEGPDLPPTPGCLMSTPPTPSLRPTSSAGWPRRSVCRQACLAAAPLYEAA